MVRHLAFLESIAESQRPEAIVTFAGFVVLRLVDDWLEIGPHTVTTTVTKVDTARNIIAAVPEGNPVRSILTGIVDAVMQSETADIEILAPQLLAYGTALAYESRWKLAIDVFDGVYHWTKARKRYVSIALDAAHYIASAYRNFGDTQEAQKSYTTLKRLAIQVGDDRKRLTAELGLAALDGMRGNLPMAEAKAQEALADAERLGLPKIRAVALQAMGYYAYKREDYDLAIRYTYSALQLSTDVRNKDRLLNTIAVMFLDRGSWQVAYDAFLILAATTQETYVRQAAMLELLRITALNHWAEDFHKYRRELQGIELPPEFQVCLYRYLAKGYVRFASINEAQEMLQLGIALAEKHKLNHALFETERELTTLNHEASLQAIPSEEISEEIRDVAIAITTIHGLTHLDL